MTKHHNLQCSAAALKHFSDVHVDSWDSQYNILELHQKVCKRTHTRTSMFVSVFILLLLRHTLRLHYLFNQGYKNTHWLNDWMHNNQLQEIVRCPQSHVLSQTNNWLKQALIFFSNCNQTYHLVTLSVIAITVSLPHIKVLICWMLRLSNDSVETLFLWDAK